MKVTTDLRPTTEVEFEMVRDVSMAWVRLPDLTDLDEEELRRAHLHALSEVFNANGPRRMGLGVGVLTPIEAEMRQRGLEADYWSMEHKRRSDAAFRSELN